MGYIDETLLTMSFLFAALALLFIILGFGGFAFGGIPTIVFWVLAALCIVAGWKSRSLRQRRREDRSMGTRV